MTQPELVKVELGQFFQADGQWHAVGHGIEVMATPDMWAGTFYIRAQETPCTREDGAGGT